METSFIFLCLLFNLGASYLDNEKESITQMEIRDIRPEDYESWYVLWRAYLEFYETEVPTEIYELTFSRLISQSHPKQCALVAEVSKSLVGLVHYISHPHNWRKEEVIYLQDLFTQPDMRGRGVGRSLIEAVYLVADKNGTPNVYWLTQDFNNIARGLYDKVATLTPFIKYNR